MEIKLPYRHVAAPSEVLAVGHRAASWNNSLGGSEGLPVVDQKCSLERKQDTNIVDRRNCAYKGPGVGRDRMCAWQSTIHHTGHGTLRIQWGCQGTHEWHPHC